MSIFWDRTNDAGDGAFYDRTNDATIGTALAVGALSTAMAVEPQASVSGFASVTLANPLWLGPGSILAPWNFQGTPLPGDVVRHATDNGFTVLPDGTCYANVNTGTYECYYDDGSGEEPFSVTLDDSIQVYPGMSAASSVSAAGAAQGGFSAEATGALAIASVVAPGGVGFEEVEALGAIGIASSAAPAGQAISESFPGDARGSIGVASSSRANGSATGAGNARGALFTAQAETILGEGNEEGVGIAIGEIGTAIAMTIDGAGRAQWGVVPKHHTIWVRVN